MPQERSPDDLGGSAPGRTIAITTAGRLRAAVSTGAFREAETLLDTYRAEVEASWHAASSPEQRAAIHAEVTALLRWARNATLASRSHTHAKIIQLSRRRAYTGTLHTIDGLKLDG